METSQEIGLLAEALSKAQAEIKGAQSEADLAPHVARLLGRRPHNRRSPRPGQANPMARLTDEIVRAMRSEHAAGASQHALARRYGVAAMTVNRAVRGLSWRTA